MATKSIVHIPKNDDSICQGDIFCDVKYNYISYEDDNNVNIIEYEFPLAVVISQACDVTAMSEMLNNHRGKPTKFMPSILMCPIYNEPLAKSGEYMEDVFKTLRIEFLKEQIYNSDELKIIKKDWHYRFHYLELVSDGKTVLEKAVVDFKHCFTVPMSYLINNKQKRVYCLDDLFAEQITLKFSAFLSRVAIP